MGTDDNRQARAGLRGEERGSPRWARFKVSAHGKPVGLRVRKGSGIIQESTHYVEADPSRLRLLAPVDAHPARGFTASGIRLIPDRAFHGMCIHAMGTSSATGSREACDGNTDSDWSDYPARVGTFMVSR